MAGKNRHDDTKVIESLADWDKLREENEDFSRRFQFYLDNEERWLREHPNTWIGITEADEVIIAGDIHELLDKAKQTGTRVQNMVAQYLDPLPRVL